MDTNLSPVKPKLKLDWASYEAARYAVEHWHYSHSLPTPPLVRVGVWEDDAFIGCVIFGRGASSQLGAAYGRKNTEVCELVRVALREHKAPVTPIVSIAIKMLKKADPGLRLIVSFADPEQGHVGGIYQGGNWVFTGRSAAGVKYIDKHGRAWHPRQVSSNGYRKQYGELRPAPRADDCEKVPVQGKYRYLYPLDAEMKAKVEGLAQPYPKKDK